MLYCLVSLNDSKWDLLFGFSSFTFTGYYLNLLILYINHKFKFYLN